MQKLPAPNKALDSCNASRERNSDITVVKEAAITTGLYGVLASVKGTCFKIEKSEAS